MTKREFLSASAGAGFSLAGCRATPDPSPVAIRKAKTTRLFKSPLGFNNGIAVTPEGLWIAEQNVSGVPATAHRLPGPQSATEEVWFVNRDGRLLKTVTTPSRDSSARHPAGFFASTGFDSLGKPFTDERI
jgi:hypothetical protein